MSETFESLYLEYEDILKSQKIVNECTWALECKGKSTKILERKAFKLTLKEANVILKMHELPKEDYILASQHGCLDGIPKSELEYWYNKNKNRSERS